VDEETKQNMYDVAINLPYIFSQREFIRQYELLLKSLSGPQLTYFEKMLQKKHYWARAFNLENSLGAHCTGMVEGINRLHKCHVSLRCGLLEYLYRTINFIAEFNNKNGISPDELIQYNTYYGLIKGSPFIIKVKDQITDFALQKLAINVIRSMSWKSKDNKSCVFKIETPNLKFLINKENELLSCSCNFQNIFKLPCEHILRILTEEEKEDLVLDYIDKRWRKDLVISTIDYISEELRKMIEEEDNDLNSKNYEIEQESVNL